MSISFLVFRLIDFSLCHTFSFPSITRLTSRRLASRTCLTKCESTLWPQNEELSAGHSGTGVKDSDRPHQTLQLCCHLIPPSPLRRHFPGGSDAKESVCSAGDPGSIPGWGRSPVEGNGSPPQCSCLENSMDRGAWQVAVHGVTKSPTWLSD